MNEDDDTDSFREIATNAIAEVSVVRIYESTRAKIETNHEFGEGLAEAPIEMVENTIAHPTEVYSSNGYPAGNYIFSSTNNTFEGNPCIVPVKVFEGTTSARVKTALFTDRPNGELVWREGSDDAE